MRILIATGIYPPKIGGPALYAQELKNTLIKQGHQVYVKTYTVENKLPSGVRHIFFFCKSIWVLWRSDLVIVLDTLSVGFPIVVLGKILGRKVVVRVGGDFLWETFVERTEKDILLKDFYKDTTIFSFKDRFIFFLTHIVLRWSKAVVFNSVWQKDIWISAYGINPKKVHIIENFYGEKLFSKKYSKKNFIWATRPVYIKNKKRLEEAFKKAQEIDSSIVLETGTMSHEALNDRIAECYAVILPSLGDVSPNLILEAVRHNKPFIVTKETGLPQEVKDLGLIVDPLSVDDIKNKILEISNSDVYEGLVLKSKLYTKVHGWEEIAQEFLRLY